MLEYTSLFKTLFFSLKSIYPFPHYNIFFFQNIWVIHPVPSTPGVIYKKLKEAELIYPQESEHQPMSVCSVCAKHCSECFLHTLLHCILSLTHFPVGESKV